MGLRVALTGDLAALATPLVKKAVNSRFASSLQAGDVTLWGHEAQPEATIRMGWVENPSHLKKLIVEILQLKADLESKGVTTFVLCGMGGSSLAPEVMAKCEGVDLGILDSTHPEVVHRFISGDLSHTGVVVSSKSGGTLETESQLRAFEQAFVDQNIDPKTRIIVVTDPGSPFETTARGAGYETFLGVPAIGGRFSALSAFGLVPSGLAGVDISRIVREASSLWKELGSDSASNPALVLGAGLAAGFPTVNKILLRPFPSLPGLGDWIEQLVAESTGKDTKGLLPVVDSALEHKEPQNTDCVSVGVGGNAAQIEIRGNLGEHFLLWQYATAFASALLGVNPFDQPNVESAKVAARTLLDSGTSTAISGDYQLQGGAIWSNLEIPTTLHTVVDALEWTTSLLGPRSYLALCVFGDSTHPDQWVRARHRLEENLGRPVTLGFGPRFLHSTGQFHKGGPRDGIFLVIIEPTTKSVPIPGRGFDFGAVLMAQARGDAQVLAATGQPTVSILFDDTQARDNLVAAIVADR